MRSRLVLAVVVLALAASLSGTAGSAPGGKLQTSGAVISAYCSGEYCGAPYPAVNLSNFDFFGSFVFAGERYVGNVWTEATVSAFTTPDTVPIPPVAITDVATHGQKLNGTCEGEMTFLAATATVDLTCTARVRGGAWGTKRLVLTLAQFDDELSFLQLQPPPCQCPTLYGVYTSA